MAAYTDGSGYSPSYHGGSSSTYHIGFPIIPMCCDYDCGFTCSRESQIINGISCVKKRIKSLSIFGILSAQKKHSIELKQQTNRDKIKRPYLREPRRTKRFYQINIKG